MFSSNVTFRIYQDHIWNEKKTSPYSIQQSSEVCSHQLHDYTFSDNKIWIQRIEHLKNQRVIKRSFLLLYIVKRFKTKTMFD